MTGKEFTAGADVILQPDDQILNGSMPDSDGVAYESLDGEAVAMIEESPSIDGMRLNSSSQEPKIIWGYPSFDLCAYLDILDLLNVLLIGAT